MTTLDVLVMEASPGDGVADATRLEEAGHRVHRCYDDSAPAHPSGWRPCVALTQGWCPLDDPIDVALLARSRVAPRPGSGEVGVRCAVRAGVPIVEHGDELLDPFADWVDHRVDGTTAVEACEAAAAAAFTPVQDRLRHLSERMLEPHGFTADQLTLRAVRDGARLAVVVHGPPVPDTTARAICDRAHAALRLAPRRHAVVDVSYSTEPA